ncbi:MAG: hypothetical protein JSV03_10820 [Planctomycetota bacterium]|nr:MAG: hypothetical protein JSV03_10820 [Planctomycetota bacterium]
MLGLFMLSGRKSWPIWLAVRSVATSVVGIVVAVILSKLAMPALADQVKELDAAAVPTITEYVLENHVWLPWTPIPALILGVSAIVFRYLRTMLAPIAAITSVAAFVVIVGSLIVVMMPIYSVPKEFGLG